MAVQKEINLAKAIAGRNFLYGFSALESGANVNQNWTSLDVRGITILPMVGNTPSTCSGPLWSLLLAVNYQSDKDAQCLVFAHKVLEKARGLVDDRSRLNVMVEEAMHDSLISSTPDMLRNSFATSLVLAALCESEGLYQINAERFIKWNQGGASSVVALHEDVRRFHGVIGDIVKDPQDSFERAAALAYQKVKKELGIDYWDRPLSVDMAGMSPLPEEYSRYMNHFKQISGQLAALAVLGQYSEDLIQEKNQSLLNMVAIRRAMWEAEDKKSPTAKDFGFSCTIPVGQYGSSIPFGSTLN